MVPVAGSAYTYAYATLGELFAWIIGWDLVLEYAVGAATVGVGWSGYFVSMLDYFGMHLPAVITSAPLRCCTAPTWPTRSAACATRAGTRPARFRPAGDRHRGLVTVILVVGIKESARSTTRWSS